MSPKSAFTYRDYEALPNDRRRYEIHDGELCVTPAPSFEHQTILSNLVRALMRHVPSVAPGLLLFAPLDVILSDRPDETTIVQPDALYIAPDRMALTSVRGRGSPLAGRAARGRPRAVGGAGWRRGGTRTGEPRVTGRGGHGRIAGRPGRRRVYRPRRGPARGPRAPRRDDRPNAERPPAH